MIFFKQKIYQNRTSWFDLIKSDTLLEKMADLLEKGNTKLYEV